MATGFIWDERCMWHDEGSDFGTVVGSAWLQPGYHPESEQTKRRIKNLLDACKLTARLTSIPFELATEADILRVHTRDYLERVKRASADGGGNLARRFTVTRVGHGGYEIALLAAGGAISAVKAVIEKTVDNAYALVRPPGHHALPDEAMGMCVFANPAIAGKYALDVLGLKRIAFVDWDVHHGNGTQAVFWEDPRALTISIHQDSYSFPPDSGHIEENGSGAGKGCTINIPMPPGSGEAAYLAAFDRVILPALKRYRPELIIVPCGFDAGRHDPLGRMLLTSEDFRQMTKRMMDAAAEICDSRLVLVHEGGYSTHSIPFMCLAVIEQLCGIRTAVEDPFLPPALRNFHPAILPHQDSAIRRVEPLINLIPVQANTNAVA